MIAYGLQKDKITMRIGAEDRVVESLAPFRISLAYYTVKLTGALAYDGRPEKWVIHTPANVYGGLSLMRYRRSKVQWCFMPDANRVTVTTECILPLLHTLKVTFGYTHASLITDMPLLRAHWATRRVLGLTVFVCAGLFRCARTSRMWFMRASWLCTTSFSSMVGLTDLLTVTKVWLNCLSSSGSTIHPQTIYLDLPARMSVASQRTHTCS